ncbi:MAG TPA: ribonuclease HII [Candidatus Thermoplasmatota archaeon]|nr:ribonuclease HII [Candidatus Thermoplasmatota archaeon]
MPEPRDAPTPSPAPAPFLPLEGAPASNLLAPDPRYALGGIDEAGRGPVMGPLVVAGVAVTNPGLPKRLGCRDSKMVLPARREALDRALRADKGVHVEVRVIAPETLDEQRRQGRSLNDIELEAFRDIAVHLDARRLYVDAADVDADRFGAGIQWAVPRTTVLSMHRADSKHAVCGAASIVAKVARDAEVAKLGRLLERKVNRPLGSGYSHDPITQEFLRAWWEQERCLPPGIRATWATAAELVAPKPMKLDAFLAGP